MISRKKKGYDLIKWQDWCVCVCILEGNSKSIIYRCLINIGILENLPNSTVERASLGAQSVKNLPAMQET